MGWFSDIFGADPEFEKRYQQDRVAVKQAPAILKATPEVAVMERPKKGYPKEVLEIHHAFETESERLVKESKHILNNSKMASDRETKAKLAKSLGFNNVAEAKDYTALQNKLKANETRLNAVMAAIEYLPNAKWIPTDSVKRICEDWKLVFGGVGSYRGFLPAKNLLEIESFKKEHHDKFFHEWYDSPYNSGRIGRFFTEEEYRVKMNLDLKSKFKEELSGGITSIHIRPSYSNLRNTLDNLCICAPKKDMEITSRQELKDGWRIQDVPDPIVLARRDFHGIEGFYIITAWGDEASDEEVVGYNEA